MRWLVIAMVVCGACELSPGGDTRPHPPAPPAPIKPVEPVVPVVPAVPSVDEPVASVEDPPAGAPIDLGDPAVVPAVMSPLSNRLRECANGFAGKLAVAIAVSPAGAVEEVVVTPADAEPAYCVAAVIRGTRFPAADARVRFRYAINFAACNAGALARQGDASFTAANPKAALGAFEAALGCSYDVTVVPRAYAAACGAKAAAQARAYFAQLPRDRQGALAQVCLTQGIDPAPADEKSLDRREQNTVVAAIQWRIQACMGTVAASFAARLVVRPDGSVDAVTVTPKSPQTSCIASALRHATFEPSVKGGVVTVPVASEQSTAAITAPRPASCDAVVVAEAETRGDTNVLAQDYVAAVRDYGRHIGCKPELAGKAMSAACRAKNIDEARQYYALLPRFSGTDMADDCHDQGLDPAPLAPGCTDLLVTDTIREGDDAFATGRSKAALQIYESQLRCSFVLGAKAVVAACAAGRRDKARLYFTKYTTPHRRFMVQDACRRFGVDPMKKP